MKRLIMIIPPYFAGLQVLKYGYKIHGIFAGNLPNMRDSNLIAEIQIVHIFELKSLNIDYQKLLKSIKNPR